MVVRKLMSPRQPTPLLEHLFAILSDNKRTRVKEILRSGLVHVNGVSATRHDTPIQPEDTVEIRSEISVATRSMPFEVLHEDATILVINKPNGLLTVGNKYERDRTVEAMANQVLAAQRQRCFIVQRLDLYTSGVLLLAKSELAQKSIQKNWGKSEKLYHAIVEGVPKPVSATLKHFLTEDERLVVHADDAPRRGSIEATLSYQSLNQVIGYTLVQIQLKTGKKNQIRAQMSAIGNPIAGDAKYGAKTNPVNRLCLHASSLSVIHPKTDEIMRFIAPLPGEFDLSNFGTR
jgi:23S rRNA pseudouridine1911/1915/1917 synthase